MNPYLETRSRHTMSLAIVALGSNLGDRAATLRSALAELEQLGAVIARSRLYETAPVGPPQPQYLNAVVLLETGRPPAELLADLLAIEKRLGRERRERWGPRVIDLDLIALDDRVVSEDGLTLPHPEAHRRAFVLVPLSEVAPDVVIPGQGAVRALASSLPAAERAGVVPFEEGW